MGQTRQQTLPRSTIEAIEAPRFQMDGARAEEAGMSFALPQYSRGEVDEAGRVLLDVERWDEIDHALEVINNWRSSHSFPLNTFQTTLRNKGRRVDPDCLVAQRIKRLWSIQHKLERFPKMRLSQVQDIGGCRAVLSTIEEVRELVDAYKRSDLRHKLARVDDYLETPQRSGYRGVHLIYKYLSDKKTKDYNGLSIEMQVRSQFQHAWATAVETVGTFIKQALKSSMGEEDWLRFFALMGTAIAYQEGTRPVANTPEDYDSLLEELRHYVRKLDVASRLEAYGNALQFFEGAQQMNAHFFILELSGSARKTTVTSFAKNQLEEAQRKYLEVERRISNIVGSEAVLVSVDSVAALQKAFPNYFLDTRIFIGLMQDALEGKPLEIQETLDTLPAELTRA